MSNNCTFCGNKLEIVKQNGKKALGCGNEKCRGYWRKGGLFMPKRSLFSKFKRWLLFRNYKKYRQRNLEIINKSRELSLARRDISKEFLEKYFDIEIVDLDFRYESEKSTSEDYIDEMNEAKQNYKESK